MYSTKTFLTRRAPRTVAAYTRSLTRFAVFLGSDMENLHTTIGELSKEELTEKLVQFSDTLGDFRPSSQRLTIGAVMSYLTYNDISIGKSHKTQIVPKKEDFHADKAFTRDDVKRLFDVGKTPIFRVCLLLMFSTGMRGGENCLFKESDLEGRIIHLKAEYTKNHKSRDVVMTEECANYLYNVWMPMRKEYIKVSRTRNIGKPGRPRKHLDDSRIVPIHVSFLYEMMMRQFKAAGFIAKNEGFNDYHPHSLRKGFRTIVGSVDIDLAEKLLGHTGYLSSSYVRKDILKEYDEKAAVLLTLSGADPRMQGRVTQLEEELKQQKEMIKLFALNIAQGKFEIQEGQGIK